MSYRDIQKHVAELYGLEISDGAITHICSGQLKLATTTLKPLRKPIYTTNAVEAVHRQFRTLTKTKGAFPNENSLLKLLYIGINQVSNKWTMPISNWALTIAQLSIYFKGRLDGITKI